MPRRLALLIATYRYQDAGLRQLAAPAHDAEALARVLRDSKIANFDVTILVNEPYHVVGDAIGEFYHNRRRDDLTLLYFTGHGLKDDEGRLYLAMANTKRDRLLFTALSAQQIDYAMDSCSSRQKVLVLDCCYSGAFPAGHISKADAEVHALEKFQGKGRVVLTASDATQYSFEGNHIVGQGTQSVFTRFLVEGLNTGEADLDGDGDIALDELYSYVHDRVIEEMPQQRPKKQENVEGRIIIARNIHWRLPTYVRNALDSPFARDRLAALEGLAHLHRVGNELVKTEVTKQTRRLIHDDSEDVSAAAMELMTALKPEQTSRDVEKPRWVRPVSGSSRHPEIKDQGEGQVITSPTPSMPAGGSTARSSQPKPEAWANQHIQSEVATEKQAPKWIRPEVEEQARREAEGQYVTKTKIGGNHGIVDSWDFGRLIRNPTTLAASAAGASAALAVTLLVVVLVIVNSGSAATIPGGAGSPTQLQPLPDSPVNAGLPSRPQPLPASVDCQYPATQQPAARPVRTPLAGPTTTRGTVSATMQTSAGPIGLTLDRALAPCTVNSFIGLAQQGFYSNTECHRLVTNPGLQVLQCGDPTGTGTGGPGYTIPDEVFPELTYPRGYVAMANTGQPNSGGSQFFLIYGDSQLPPSYTVFGTVSPDGLKIIEEIAKAGSDGSLDPSPGGGKPKQPVTITSLDVAT